MKPNVFVISWKYSLIICAIISASFISIYLEIKKNQKFIQTFSSSIRELRDLFINNKNNTQLFYDKQNLNNNNYRSKLNQSNLKKNSTIKNNNNQYKPKIINNQNINKNYIQSESENKNDINSETIVSNLKNEIIDFENQINEINKSLQIDCSTTSYTEIISNNDVNLNDLANKVNENIENKTYSPEDSLHDHILNHLESEQESDLDRDKLNLSNNLEKNKIDDINSINIKNIECISKEINSDNNLQLKDNQLDNNQSYDNQSDNNQSNDNQSNDYQLDDKFDDDNQFEDNHLDDYDLDNNNFNDNKLDNKLNKENLIQNNLDISNDNNLRFNSEINSNQNSQISTDSDLHNLKKKNLLDICMTKYSAKELMDLCKNNNLIIRGNKNILINRLISNNILNLSNLDNNLSVINACS